MTPGPPRTDSGGVPWTGRTLSPTGFEGDDGSAEPSVARAVATGDLPAVVGSLPGARLLVPVVADEGDMALVTLTAPDGRRTLPAFTCTAALAAWDASARPVPVEARRAALSAVDEGCELIVLDPGTASLLLPRPAVWTLAQGAEWVPSPRRDDVAQALRRAVAGVPEVTGVHGEPGRRAELAVVLAVRSGLSREQLSEVISRVSRALAAEQVVADHVDSLELRILSACPPAIKEFPVDPRA